MRAGRRGQCRCTWHGRSNYTADRCRCPVPYGVRTDAANVRQEVPASRDNTRDFQCWCDDRLMAHYRDIRPWVAMILGERSPLAMLGQWQGRMSLIYPRASSFDQALPLFNFDDVGSLSLEVIPVDLRSGELGEPVWLGVLWPDRSRPGALLQAHVPCFPC